jgi:hypothetical protein
MDLKEDSGDLLDSNQQTYTLREHFLTRSFLPQYNCSTNSKLRPHIDLLTGSYRTLHLHLTLVHQIKTNTSACFNYEAYT